MYASVHSIYFYILTSETTVVFIASYIDRFFLFCQQPDSSAPDQSRHNRKAVRHGNKIDGKDIDKMDDERKEKGGKVGNDKTRLAGHAESAKGKQ